MTEDLKGRLPIKAAADTHVGLVRKANEDSFGYCVDSDADVAMFAVADGIGGHGNGDVASAICIRLLLEEWRNVNVRNLTAGMAQAFLKNTLEAANHKIFEINNRFSFRYPMGTTIVAGVVLPDSVVVVHIGDSRFYCLSGQRLDKLTEDHSFVAEMVKNKIISPEEAKTHPFSHIISRSIGPNDKIEPDFRTIPRQSGDRILLCSDGLTNYANDLEMQVRMLEDDSPQRVVNNLLKLALKRGGDDNVTIVSAFI